VAAAGGYLEGIGSLALEVLGAILPIAVVTVVLRPLLGRFPVGLVRRVTVGLTLTFAGTVLFLQGVNIGFAPAGELLGRSLASPERPWVLSLLGLWLGFVVALAEPAVKVLSEEVEAVSAGSVPARALLLSVALGVGALVAVALWRVAAGVPLLYILIPGYGIAFILARLAPPAYTSIAFDAGGSVTGPITVTFILAVSVGAASALEGRDPLTDGFGLVALVLLAPALSVLALGVLLRPPAQPAQEEEEVRTDVQSGDGL